MSRPCLDDIDRLLLQALQQNGRITNVELARLVKLSPPTVLERVRRLEESGVIQGYTALLDPQKLELGLMAFVVVNLSPHTRRAIERFQREIMKLPQVVECYYLAGEEDFLLKVYHRDIASYRDFLISKLTTLPGVKKVRTLIVFNAIKQSHKLPLQPEKVNHDRRD